ncbi:prenyltransferase, partial [Fulvivirga sp. RKSG066]|nr:prenyltransferase [Fulvivirga aurantia]
SPMYHQIILNRLLDCINLTQNNHNYIDKELNMAMLNTAKKMLSWIEVVTFHNGDIPMVNDSTYGIAPTTAELQEYARRLKITWAPLNIKESGYRV